MSWLFAGEQPNAHAVAKSLAWITSMRMNQFWYDGSASGPKQGIELNELRNALQIAEIDSFCQ